MTCALWIEGPGRVALRPETPAPAPGEVVVETLFTGISRGTERLVLAGAVPPGEHDRMRCPLQAGDFPFPVKYGYAAVGRIAEGPPDRLGQTVFALAPHQSRFACPEAMAIPLPEGLPPARAVLAANMETALNVVWDAGIAPGDRVAVVGAGVVGALAARLAARIPGTEVTLIDLLPARAALAEALGCRFATPDAGMGAETRVVTEATTGATAGATAATGTTTGTATRATTGTPPAATRPTAAPSADTTTDTTTDGAPPPATGSATAPGPAPRSGSARPPSALSLTPGSADAVIHASASAAGLATALALAGPEATVVEASWYGDRAVPAPLGAAFHSQRLRLVSSQVGRLPPLRAPRWSFARRLAKALELLRDPATEALISGETAFDALPAAYADIVAAPGTLCHRVRY